ncbi:MAG: hypothetical protein FWF85_02415 [Clostridiales bacterium]|nr:hypothetical protein [Clostridiales bacterium]
MESNTSEAIMARLLSRIPNDEDKRESSIAYNALASAAIELAQVYAALAAKGGGTN